MAIIRGRDIEILRQEGDTSDVSFIVPDALNLPVTTTAIFEVKDSKYNVIFTVDTAITITGQNIFIPLAPSDTKGYFGNFRWELQIKDTSFGILTIGGGIFKIRKELILTE